MKNPEPGTPEPGTPNPEPRTQTMTRSYVQVIVLEAFLLVALWIFGRLFA